MDVDDVNLLPVDFVSIYVTLISETARMGIKLVN